MDVGQSDRVANLFLRHRKLAAQAIAQPGRAHANREFAQQMRDAAARVAAADIGDPLACDRCIDKRVDPQRAADIGVAESQLLQHRSFDIDGRDLRERLYVVIGIVQEQMLQVEKVAGDLDRDDLARTLEGELLAIGEATDDEAAMGEESRSFADEIGGRLISPQDIAKRQDRGFAFGGDRGPRSQFPHHGAKRLFDRHANAPLGPGARSLSQSPMTQKAARRWFCFNM